MSDNCKHCRRCKDGCDYCAHCDVCHKCGVKRAHPLFPAAPTFVPVPYPVPSFEPCRPLRFVPWQDPVLTCSGPTSGHITTTVHSGGNTIS